MGSVRPTLTTRERRRYCTSEDTENPGVTCELYQHHQPPHLHVFEDGSAHSWYDHDSKGPSTPSEGGTP